MKKTNYQYKELVRGIATEKSLLRPGEGSPLSGLGQDTSRKKLFDLAPPEEEHYKLYQRHVMMSGDTGWDSFGYTSTPPDFTTFVDYQAFHQYTVPPASSLTVQGYSFFVVVDNSPAQPQARKVLAEPLEFIEVLVFKILINKNPPVDSSRTLAGYANRRFSDGFSVLSRDPDMSSRQINEAIAFVAPGGSVIEVGVQALNTGVAPYVLSRPILGLGCRLRGFLRPNR